MPEQRAFAAAAPAHDHERLAAANIERDVVEDHAVSEFSDKISNLDYWRVIGFVHDQNDERRMTSFLRPWTCRASSFLLMFRRKRFRWEWRWLPTLRATL